MGEKGTKLTARSETAARRLEKRIGSIGTVSRRKMFGGVGLFESGKMFAIVSSKGELFLKVDSASKERYRQAGSKQHGRMPYFSIPPEVLADEERLLDWATAAVGAAHSG